MLKDLKRKKKICCYSCCYVSLAETYRVVVWTTDRYGGETDGDVYIKFTGDRCLLGWHYLNDTRFNIFERGSGDNFSFTDVDIGSKVN